MDKSIRLFKFPIFSCHFEKGFYWFRIFGRGIKWKDTTKYKLLFSERLNIEKSMTIGKWRIATLGKQIDIFY